MVQLRLLFLPIISLLQDFQVEIKEEKIEVAEEPKVVEPVETVVDETPVEPEPEVITSKLFEVENTSVDADAETTDEDIKETPKTKKRSKKNTQ